MNMFDSGAHSQETERMQQVIDKQERDIMEQTEAIQVLKDEVSELRGHNKELEAALGHL